MTVTPHTQAYNGGCFCRSITYTVTGPPVFSVYCHCTLCQRSTASPFIHTIHFPVNSFTWTHTAPEQSTREYYEAPIKPWMKRWRCKHCGTPVATYNGRLNRWCVRGATLDRDSEGRIIDWESIKPTAHMFYDTRLLDVPDDLPKWEGVVGMSTRLE